MTPENEVAPAAGGDPSAPAGGADSSAPVPAPAAADAAGAAGSPPRAAVGFSVTPPPVAVYRGLGIWGALGLGLLFIFVAGFAWTEVAFLQALLGARLPVAVQLLTVHLSASAATLWVGLPRSGLTAARAFPLRRIPAGVVLAILLAVPGLMLVLPLLTHWLPEPPRGLVRFFEQVAREGLIPALLVIGVGAPILEELIFRGLLLGALRRRFSTATAVIVSTAVFMLIHGNFSQGSAAFVLGLLACWLVLRTGSLLSSMLLHVTWNSSALGLGALAYVHAPRPGATATEAAPALPWLLLGATAAAVGLFALWWQLRGLPRPVPAGDPPPPPRAASGRLATALFAPLGIVLMTAAMIGPGRRQSAWADMAASDPAPFAGCYELSSPAAPLPFFQDSSASTLRVRLTLEPAPRTRFEAPRFVLRSLATGAAAGQGVYWFPDSRDGIRLVAMPSGLAGTIVRALPRDSSLAGSLTRYGADGRAAGPARPVTGRRIACPGSARP